MSENAQMESTPESYTMNGGDGAHSYNKNSYFQKQATSLAKTAIDECVVEKLNVKQFSPSLKTFRIADLGCSVGPNTFLAVQNIVQTVQHCYRSQASSSQLPSFQVFFNDHVSNDFNTLFTSLPSDRSYYAAGVPGSFHGRLFPDSSLHFAHSSYALQWLSKVPDELLDANSPAYNKGRVHYSGARDEVGDAYLAQFSQDMESFFSARGKEMARGGIMVIIMPGKPNDIPHSSIPMGVMFDLIGFSLMDMAKEGIIREDQVDSFNLPLFVPSPDQMTTLIERNGSFSIERMDLTAPRTRIDGPVGAPACILHLRAGFEGIVSKHLGSGIVDELFARTLKKTEEFSDRLRLAYMGGSQLLVILKRK